MLFVSEVWCRPEPSLRGAVDEVAGRDDDLRTSPGRSVDCDIPRVRTIWPLRVANACRKLYGSVQDRGEGGRQSSRREKAILP